MTKYYKSEHGSFLKLFGKNNIEDAYTIKFDWFDENICDGASVELDIEHFIESGIAQLNTSCENEECEKYPCDSERTIKMLEITKEEYQNAIENQKRGEK
jgi:hypothetical protein